MNRAQRDTLWMVLAVDGLLILYPPFERRAGWRTFDLGHDLLPLWLLDGSGSPDFGRLAAEIIVVSIIGFTVYLLAGGLSEESAEAAHLRLVGLGRTVCGLPRRVRASLSMLPYRPFVLAMAFGLGVGATILLSGAVNIGSLGKVADAVWRWVEPAPIQTATATDSAGRVTYLLKRAQTGNAQAQLDLAILYAKGEGVPQDYATAATWFRAAAKQGVPRAQYDLGMLYERGRGVAVSYADAFAWYKKAAEANYPLAQLDLAILYAKGEGVPRDLAAAASWFRAAAKQGVPRAQYDLGMLYERGEGVAASAVDAYAWYRAAAERGSQRAANRAKELFEALDTPDRPTAIVRASEVAASIREPPGGVPGIDYGGERPSAPWAGNPAATGR